MLFFNGSLPVAVVGVRDGSVQSDASSSPSEQSQLGQSHPGYPMGPQVSKERRYFSDQVNALDLKVLEPLSLHA